MLTLPASRSDQSNPRLPAFVAGRPRWRRRHARWLASALAALATFVGLGVLAPPEADGVAVVVTTRAVPAGRALTEADLAVVRYPSGLAPGGVLTTQQEALGRRLTGATEAGEPLTVTRLSGEHAVPDGHVALSVAVPDESLAWITPGAEALLMGPEQSWEAVVLAVEGAENRGGGLGVSTTRRVSVLVAVRSRIANEIARAGVADSLFLALRP